MVAVATLDRRLAHDIRVAIHADVRSRHEHGGGGIDGIAFFSRDAGLSQSDDQAFNQLIASKRHHLTDARLVIYQEDSMINAGCDLSHKTPFL